MNNSFSPVFSGGTGRSGTTIVGKLLGRHSKIKCGKPYEIKFLTDIFSLTDLAFGMRDFSSQEISKKSRLYLHLMPLSKYEPRLKKFSGKMLNEWYERKNRLDNNSGLHLGISKKKIRVLLGELHEGASQDLEGACRQFFTGLSTLRDNTSANLTGWTLVHQILCMPALFIDFYQMQNLSRCNATRWTLLLQ